MVINTVTITTELYWT